MFKFKVNDKFELESDAASSIDISQIDEKRFHLLKNNKSYQIELLKADINSNLFTVKVNGNEYEVKALSELEQLLSKMGIDAGSTSKINELKAPMPGAVIAVQVKAGQTILKGEALLILEAMKMENVLKSPTDGVIKEVRVEKGKNVDKNDVLIVFE